MSSLWETRPGLHANEVLASLSLGGAFRTCPSLLSGDTVGGMVLKK